LDPDSIDRIRSATFPTARRGYDQREVDGFLSKLADWLETGGDDQARAELVRRELERIGDQTGRILTDAHDAGEQLRAEADTYSATTREGADAYAEKIREEADEEAAAIRSRADSDAEQMVERARVEARRIVDEANRRRRDVEAVISDLEHRRDAVIAEMQRLSSELAGSVTDHGGAQEEGPQEAVAEKPG
jgi:cell division initiation protein